MSEHGFPADRHAFPRRALSAVLLLALLLLSSAAVLASPPSGSSSAHAVPPSADARGTPSSSSPPRSAPTTTDRAHPRVFTPPTTSINGSVHINGSLSASTTYVDGNVNIDGSADAQDLTQSSGWADYGPTVVTGGLSVGESPGSSATIFTSNPGSSLWLQPSPLNTTAVNVLEGNLAFGDASTGSAFDMQTVGVNITIDANQAGGFYSYPSTAANIAAAPNSHLINYANSSGSVSVSADVVGIPITETVAPGKSFNMTICTIPLVGCIAISALSLTWPAGSHFSIVGGTNTSGQGLTASLPDTRMDIQVPEGSGVRLSMTPSAGAPSISVSPGATYPAELLSQGRVVMSLGEVIQGTVQVQGNFSATGFADNSGTFANFGGLTIQGSINAEGEQVFRHKLEIGDQVAIDLFPGFNLTSGPTSIDSDVVINGTTVATGSINISGELIQNASQFAIEGALSVNGTLAASGLVSADGTTTFAGRVSSTGNISMPHADLDGTFLLSDGAFSGVGSTVLTGTSVAHGWTWVNGTTYSVTGSSWLNGTISVNRSITVNGDVEISTAPGGEFHLNATVLMGTEGPGAAWTSRVQGTVVLRGESFANGTSTFDSSEVTFPPGIKVVGSVLAQGNVSVDGTTFFQGAVTSSGLATFPGMQLDGTFGLSSSGGSVNGTGTSGVVGTVSLDGVLTVDHGVFSEVGSSDITGDLTMTGTVLVTGDSTLSTASGTNLSLAGNIELAGAAHIEGNVNTSGQVTIEGSASLSSTAVNISGALSANGVVYTRGIIQLKGRADFDGPLDTLGRTSLPGLAVEGNYTLSWGTFDLDGSIALTGYTHSVGSVVANSTGYYVTGQSRIIGDTVATGSAVVWGTSLTVGYVQLGAGAQLATYMVVHGGMSAGGVDFSGTIILPNDTVVFTEGANISGSVWQHGLLTSSGGTITFYGESNVTGTVESSGTPNLAGPLVVPLLGGIFALTLGPEFYLYLGGLVVGLLIAALEVFLFTWKFGAPAARNGAAPRRAVRAMRWAGLALLGVGAVVGAAFGFSDGSRLATGVDPSTVGSVAVGFYLADALLLAGIVLWVLGRWVLPRRQGTRPSSTEPASAAKAAEPSPTWAEPEAPATPASGT